MDLTLKVLAEGMITHRKTQILGTEPGSDFLCPWSVLFKETIDFCHYTENSCAKVAKKSTSNSIS